MEIAFAVVVAIGALVFVFIRMGRARIVADAPQPRRMSRRERKLARIRENDPLPEPKSIFDLIREEATELGVDEIPGGEGLETPVKLKVWRRDEATRRACGDAVRYEIITGAEPAAATIDDVRLVCADGTHPAPGSSGPSHAGRKDGDHGADADSS